MANTYSRKARATSALVLTLFLASGCNTMPTQGGARSGTNSPAVGPLAGMLDTRSNTVVDPNAQTERAAVKQSVLLSVAVPEFDEGFAKTPSGEIDYDETTEMGIWPQLRRTESKKFAFKTKQAIEQTGSFGAVSVTPDTMVPADVFVLGKILESNSQTVEVQVTVQSVSGEV
ncbi:MAG: hypothetical protein R3194_08965, partial [Limnobacter sp.]|nr:hypothetical protein [Limnobacter sp.]